MSHSCTSSPRRFSQITQRSAVKTIVIEVTGGVFGSALELNASETFISGYWVITFWASSLGTVRTAVLGITNTLLGFVGIPKTVV
jgi:hypothetical protein